MGKVPVGTSSKRKTTYAIDVGEKVKQIVRQKKKKKVLEVSPIGPGMQGVTVMSASRETSTPLGPNAIVIAQEALMERGDTSKGALPVASTPSAVGEGSSSSRSIVGLLDDLGTGVL